MAGVIVTRPDMTTRPGQTIRVERIVLPERDFTVGRGEGNDLVLADMTVSKNHSVFHWDPVEGVFSLEDLGSKNGTIVNKRKIKQSMLGDGAEIQIGLFLLLFSAKMGQLPPTPEKPEVVEKVEEKSAKPPEAVVQKKAADQKKAAEQKTPAEPRQAAPPKRPAEPRITAPSKHEAEQRTTAAESKEKGKSKAWRWKALGVTVLVLVLAGGGYLMFNHFQQMFQDRLSSQEEGRVRAQDELHFVKGAQYHEQRKWAEAIEELEQVSESSEHHGEADGMIDQATSEIVHQGEYQQLLAALAEEDLPLAIMKAATIPPTSLYYAEVEEKIAAAKADLLAKLQTDGEQLLEKGQWDGAIDRFDEALQIDPESETLIQLKNTAMAKKLYSRSASLYVQGKTADAMSALDSISQLGLPSGDRMVRNGRNRKSLIRELVELYNGGARLLAQGNEAQAIRSWEDMLEREKKLVRPRTSYYYRDVSTKISGHYCRKADKEYDAAKLIPAYEFWNKALAIDPACHQAKTGVKQIDQEAMNLYQEGCSLAESNNLEQAIINWEIVLTTVPPTHDYHKKAMKKLAESEPGS